MVFDIFWMVISYFADVQFWFGLAVATLIIYQIISKDNRKKITWLLLALLPAVIISDQIVDGLKNYYKVPRPCAGQNGCPSDYSFPSGHAAAAASFATIVSLETRRKRFYISVIPLSILIALSRVFLNYHTLADIGVGFAIGIGVSWIVFEVYRDFVQKWLEGVAGRTIKKPTS